MKMLPCRHCGPRGASLPKSAAYPAGEPHLTAANPGAYVCARCGRRSTLSTAEFNRLPDCTLEDFEGLSREFKAQQLKDLPTKDVEGAGFSREQARDLFRAGFHAVSELEKEAR